MFDIRLDSLVRLFIVIKILELGAFEVFYNKVEEVGQP